MKILNYLPLREKNRKSNETGENVSLNVQSKFTDVAVFVPVKETVCAVLFADECRSVVADESLTVNFVKLKLFRKNFDLIQVMRK